MRNVPKTILGVQELLGEGQDVEVNLTTVAGFQTTDQAFDFLNSGLYSTENNNISFNDSYAKEEISGCYLTQYSVSASVGALVEISTTHVGSSVSTGATLYTGETEHSAFEIFSPSDISFAANFADASGAVSFPIQSVDISVGIPRRKVVRHGSFEVTNRIPEPRQRNTFSFSVHKNDVEATDFDDIILNTGDVQIYLDGCDGNILFGLRNSVFKGLTETNSLDGVATYDFEFNFEKLTRVKSTGEISLFWDDSEFWNDSNFWVE